MSNKDAKSPEAHDQQHTYICPSCRQYPLTFISRDDVPDGGRSVYNCSSCGMLTASLASTNRL